jgi:hypothetical protein
MMIAASSAAPVCLWCYDRPLPGVPTNIGVDGRSDLRRPSWSYRLATAALTGL